MKIDCGETYLEQHARLSQWHRWFAWHPIRLGSHDCRWLEKIWRKGEYYCSYASSGWTWKYREKMFGDD